jgi:uncharacterized protein YbjT (DUF2867 family)
MKPTLLITGANGTIGRHLTARLQALGLPFATMSSRAEAGSVQGSFDDVASLKAAFAGVHTLFLLLPLVPQKLEWARNAVAAAQAAGVSHIVRSSGLGADPASPNPLARLQGQIDQLIEGSGIAHTFLRPAGFMQNWATFAAGQVKDGVVYAPHGDGAQSLIDARDIADAAAAVLANPAPHAGKAYDLTGSDVLNDAQQLAIMGQALGRELRYVDVPEEAAQKTMQDMGMPAVMIDWFMGLHHVIKQGWAAGVTDHVQHLTGHAPRRFEVFVAENVDAWR